MEHATLGIEGMSCGRCLNTVRGALSAVPGARVETVQMGLAKIEYDPARTTPEALARAVTEEGYRAFVIP